VIDGWWNELPSRTPPQNAGRVYFEMTRDRAGSASPDRGQWLFGLDGDWWIWELIKVSETIPAAAQAKLEDASVFTTGYETPPKPTADPG